MDIVSFQIHCIEFYSGHIQKSGNEVYVLFKQSGLLKMLETDFEDLHGLGTEALMQFCDHSCFSKGLSGGETRMTIENCLGRSVLIPAIVKILSHYYGITPAEAMQRFYESNTAACLADESLGLYGQSPLYNAGLFIMEKDGKIDKTRLG